jgi:hypothetical protein
MMPVADHQTSLIYERIIALMAEVRGEGCEVCGHKKGQQQTGPRNKWQIQTETLQRENLALKEAVTLRQEILDDIEHLLDQYHAPVSNEGGEQRVSTWRRLELLHHALQRENERLREAIDKARRESASAPGNRWARNATIILDAALAKPGKA